MDKNEQKKRFNSNLVMPSADINMDNLPHDFIASRFTLFPISSEYRLQYGRVSFVAPSHTLALVAEAEYYELYCIVLLFTKLLLPNIVYYHSFINIGREIGFDRLSITIRKILQLSEVLERKIFYEKYKDNLGVDLRE